MQEKINEYETYDLILMKYLSGGSAVIKMTCQFTGNSMFDCMKIVETKKTSSCIYSDDSSVEQKAKFNVDGIHTYNKPKCPTCSSINIEKIGSINRAVCFATFGFESGKMAKLLECKNCGYKW